MANSTNGKQETVDRYKRLTINLPQEVWQELSARAESRGVSVTELIRRAIALEGYLQDEATGADRILVERGDSLRELVFV